MTGILITNISDHYPIFHIVQCQKTTQAETYQLIRLINESNLQKYINNVQSHDWTIVNQYRLFETAFSYFSETLKIIFCDAFPVIRVKQRYRNRLPWLTDVLKKAIQTKNKLYKIYMKYDTGFNKIADTQYKNQLTSISKRHEKEYYKSLLETNKNNLKKTWTVIRNDVNNCKQTKLNDSFSYNH